MSQDFNTALEKIKTCMQNAGDMEFSSNKLKEASIEQLRPTEDTIVEHWKIYQGATAYYTFLLNQAQTSLEDNEDELRKVMLMNQAELLRLAKGKYGMSRPAKDDLLIIAIIEGTENVNDLHEAVKYFKDAVRHLQSWVDGWEKKSFCLNGISQAAGVNNGTLRSPKTPE